MPLSIQLLSRPVRVVRLVVLAGLLALVAGAAALYDHPLTPLATMAALLATGMVLGVLAPLYGRAAAIGLWAARAGIAMGACAFLIPVGGPATAVRLAGAMLVVVGLRLVARGTRRLGDLPPWASSAVVVGIGAALLAPAIGGAIVLALAWLAVAAGIHGTHVVPTPATRPAVAPVTAR